MCGRVHLLYGDNVRPVTDVNADTVLCRSSSLQRRSKGGSVRLESARVTWEHYPVHLVCELQALEYANQPRVEVGEHAYVPKYESLYRDI